MLSKLKFFILSKRISKRKYCAVYTYKNFSIGVWERVHLFKDNEYYPLFYYHKDYYSKEFKTYSHYFNSNYNWIYSGETLYGQQLKDKEKIEIYNCMMKMILEE